ncbi:MAG: sulfite exporter TauE/SafE family protein [Alphaproteobacteria bacterium]|nr:sulfite exporter TauE/SafE family protein [Alphaproteobacteria bacterium]
MQIYLPIAEMSVSIFLLLGMGGGVGFLSGMFGVGGGFLMTPLLIFIGVPPAVAVASEANQVAAASVSGVIAHWRRGNVDFILGFVMLLGGGIGSAIGVLLFRYLREIGQVELMISVAYVVFLSIIGVLMVIESVRAILRSRRPGAPRRRLHTHYWVHGWPLRLRFPKSKLYISAIPPFGLGLFVGILAAIMGVGGGFFLVPAMIYLLGMPTILAVGTSLFQIIFVTSIATFLHAIANQTVDVMLALILLLGAVFGAQLGSLLGAELRGEQLRALLGTVVVSVAAKMGFDLVATPDDLFSVGPVIEH